jgi:hypothetical protein
MKQIIDNKLDLGIFQIMLLAVIKLLKLIK